jgi:hypothetical protein
MELACLVLNSHFEPLLLPMVSKNYDEEDCFLAQFGFNLLAQGW